MAWKRISKIWGMILKELCASATRFWPVCVWKVDDLTENHDVFVLAGADPVLHSFLWPWRFWGDSLFLRSTHTHTHPSPPPRRRRGWGVPRADVHPWRSPRILLRSDPRPWSPPAASASAALARRRLHAAPQRKVWRQTPPINTLISLLLLPNVFSKQKAGVRRCSSRFFFHRKMPLV